MKKILPIVLICSLVLGGMFAIFGPRAKADVDANCPSLLGTVPTNFTGTAPSSVTVNSDFTFKNITSSAAITLPEGVVITSSDLKLSATNASKTTYFKANYSSYADPKTGYKRAVFPDWPLKATGSAGSKVVIKLVEARAHVQGIGATVCPLNQTLATIDITASQSTGNGSTANPSPDDTPKDETTKEEEKPKEKKKDSQASPSPLEESTDTTQSVRIVVKDESDNFIGGATVTINEQTVTTSQLDGSAEISGISPGQQTVKVTYANTTILKSIYVTTVDSDNTNQVVMPHKPSMPFGLFFAASAVIFTLSSAFITTRFF